MLAMRSRICGQSFLQLGLTWMDWHALAYGLRNVINHGDPSTTLETGILNKKTREAIRTELSVDLVDRQNEDMKTCAVDFSKCMLSLLDMVEHPRVVVRNNKTCFSTRPHTELPSHMCDVMCKPSKELIDAATLWFPRLCTQLALQFFVSAKTLYPWCYGGYKYPEQQEREELTDRWDTFLP